jgi:hypothetical protein
VIRTKKRTTKMLKIVDNWSAAWRSRFFREQFLFSALALLAAFVVMRFFIAYVERRGGIGLPDPVLSLFTAIDLKWITYSIVYSSVVLGAVSLATYPHSFLLAIRAAVLLVGLRIVFLFLLPLDPPPGCIPLVDPFIRTAALSPATSRDLFFSWHTALICLFAFSARYNDMKLVFFCAAALVSVLFLLQHVHYVIDIVAAPCFAYVAYGIARSNTMRESPAKAPAATREAPSDRTKTVRPPQLSRRAAGMNLS